MHRHVPVLRSRRALLAAALGGLAALVGEAVARPPAARADGEAMTVGGQYATATVVTSLRNTANANTVFAGTSDGSGIGVNGSSVYGTGVHGQSTAGIGVSGESDSDAGVSGASTSGTGVDGSSGPGTGVFGSSDSGTGVHGISASGAGVYATSGSGSKAGAIGQATANGTGLLGFSGGASATPPAAPAKTGVYGYAAQDTAARGVSGATTAGRGVDGVATSGTGVHGEATFGRGVYGQASSGVGGYFLATTGMALKTSGRVRFDKASGLATIAAGLNKVVVTPGIDITGSSRILATLQSSAGGTTTVHRVGRDTVADKFTIYLTKAATQQCTVAWFVIG